MIELGKEWHWQSDHDYLLFSGHDYYPHGGICDLTASFATAEEAKDKAITSGDEWWHIVNIKTRQLVDTGHT